MGLKILGGMARGHTINIPKSESFRPTSIRLKRRLFDFCQDWSGSVFVDLCAGSGAVGIEAWSRGANKSILVENNRQALILMKKNLSILKDKYPQDFSLRPIKVVPISAKKWVKEHLENLLVSENSVTIFFDPPYQNIELYREVLAVLANLSQHDSLEIWVESDKSKGPDIEALTNMKAKPCKIFEQGTNFLILLE
jgi:16S rRNA (guanine966-N2)-methyltransferase